MSLFLLPPTLPSYYTKKLSVYKYNPQVSVNDDSFFSVKPRVPSHIKSVTIDQQVPRRNPNFDPTIWGDHFVKSIHPSNSELESYARDVSVLKEEVTEMLMASTSDPIQNIHFIDLLCRLGLDYHYETEIELQLHRLYHGQDNIFQDNNYDLDTMSRLFRLCRQYGYDISPVVFDKFLDNKGKFKLDLAKDTKGMLSLYEASHLSINGEDILDEALDFTKTHLKSLIDKPIEKHLEEHISNALALPFHKVISREAAKKYIFFYEHEDCRDDKVLKFAKCDYNLVMLMYQQELNYLSSWWTKTDLLSEYPFNRDRVVELYGWAVMTMFEPCYRRSRIAYTQLMMLLVIVDDFVDSYGTPEEIQLLAEAIRRWDIIAIDTLPNYLHSLYRNILNLCDELDKEAINKGKPYWTPAVKNVFIEVSNFLEAEAQWCHKGYVPTLNEYLRISNITTAIRACAAISFLEMESANEEAFEWIQRDSKFLNAGMLIARLTNDVVSQKREQRTGQHATSVECYMKQYGSLSEEQVIKELKHKVVIQWKILNEEFFRPTPLPYHLMLRIINLARTCEAWYFVCDAYTEPEYAKDLMSLLFVDKIHV